jgi:hypothetical protein
MPTQYRVISAESPDQLVNKVTLELTQGFLPIGGIAVTVMGSKAYFYQAVVKEG